MTLSRSVGSVLFLSTAISLAFIGSAAAASAVQTQCSQKYQAAKSAGTLAGQSWNQFYKQCAAEARGEAPAATAPAATAPAATPAAPAATPTAAPAAPPAAAPKPTATAPKPTAPAAPSPMAPAAEGNVVFPTAIAPQYSTLSPGRARFKTCNDQYNANKATNGNGPLKWIQKGGGYYSECNRRLKG